MKFDVQRSKRRFSILSYLYSMRPGDLVFFFQADPQWPADILNRRGFRGIWRVASSPFRDTASIRLNSTSYEILGSCPGCGSPFDFGANDLEKGKKCPLCGASYGLVEVHAGEKKKKFSRVVLSARILIEPLVIFEKTAGDNRVYCDMETEPLIWVSRADNAMGKGKGSSIRTLLPEEAAKVAYMLATEDSQKTASPPTRAYPGGKTERITDHNGVEVKYPRLVRTQGETYILAHELHLNMYFSLHIDNPNHPLPQLLDIPLREVDYWSTEFPWGYTADTADFVLSCWDEGKGRYRIYIFEFKREDIDRMSIAEVLLYIPWVTQIMTMFRHETEVVEVIPVLVGRTVKISHLPSGYSFQLKTIAGSRRTINVKTPVLLTYEPARVFWVKDALTKETAYYAEELNFNSKSLPTRSITPPPRTYTTTNVEKEWVAKSFLKPLG